MRRPEPECGKAGLPDFVFARGGRRKERFRVALGFGASSITVDRLGPADLVDLFAFLDEDPVLHVYLTALAARDALARPNDPFWAARREGRIVAAMYVGSVSGALLPAGDDEDGLSRLAATVASRVEILPRRLQLIGSRAAVECFAPVLHAAGLRPRLRRAQRYLALERGALRPFERVPELRTARPDDLPLLYQSGAELRIEELEEDPRITDGAAYARRVEEEGRDQHTWLWLDREGLRFRASVSAVTADAAQISGVFTPAARRRRGFAARGLSELCLRMFERCQAVCLFVNEINQPALALYDAMGFRKRADWGSIFYDRR